MELPFSLIAPLTYRSRRKPKLCGIVVAAYLMIVIEYPRYLAAGGQQECP